MKNISEMMKELLDKAEEIAKLMNKDDKSSSLFIIGAIDKNPHVEVIGLVGGRIDDVAVTLMASMTQSKEVEGMVKKAVGAHKIYVDNNKQSGPSLN